MKLTLPNILSLSRVLISPVILIFLLSGNSGLIKLSCFLFFIAALTDYLDGWYARKFKQTSDWGRFFDPLADKVLVLFVFAAFVFMDIIPLWMFAIIAIRDLGTTFLRVYGNVNKRPIETSYFAKIKTFIQMLFISFILLVLFIGNLNIFANKKIIFEKIIFSDFTVYGMFLITIITILTMFEYFFAFFFKKIKKI